MLLEKQELPRHVWAKMKSAEKNSHKSKFCFWQMQIVFAVGAKMKTLEQKMKGAAISV